MGEQSSKKDTLQIHLHKDFTKLWEDYLDVMSDLYRILNCPASGSMHCGKK